MKKVFAGTISAVLMFDIPVYAAATMSKQNSNEQIDVPAKTKRIFSE